MVVVIAEHITDRFVVGVHIFNVGFEVLQFCWTKLFKEVIRDMFATLPGKSFNSVESSIEIGQDAPDIPLNILASYNYLSSLFIIILVEFWVTLIDKLAIDNTYQ